MRSLPDGREQRLWRALVSLAEEPGIAQGWSPARKGEAVRRPVAAGFAENLVFEFDEAYTAFVEGFETLPSESQLISLQAVDTQVSSMVRAKDAELWTEQAWCEAADWQHLRRLARAVLSAFEWPRL